MAGWENVIRRTQQKSGLLAAYLKHWQVVGVEDSSEGVVVLLQAANQRHFENVRSNDRPRDIEWALNTEFGQPCKVRLVPPGQAPTSSTLSYTRGPASDVASSAHRDRSSPSLSPEVSRPARDQEVSLTDTSHSTRTLLTDAGRRETSPCAETPEVDEKKRALLSREEAQQKAQQDPIVQEAIKVFGARLKDVQPQ